MRNVHDLRAYKQAVIKLSKIKGFIEKLDNMQKMLENELSMPGSIELFHKIEEIKIDYMFQELECNKIITFKGNK